MTMMKIYKNDVDDRMYLWIDQVKRLAAEMKRVKMNPKKIETDVKP